MSEKTKILFDGNCVVCDMEIAHYKRMAPEKFELVDISSPDFDVALYNLKKEDVNLNLHVVTPQGKILVGVNAFAHIWSRLQKYQWASKFIKWPVVNPLANFGYWQFTKIRPYLPKKK